jgi:pyruvate/2-oxoglutarate dehydrogenase complex dihydrolipoamide dehydrogenase (E3) component
MKILVDKETKHILGASLLGPTGDEVIHLHSGCHVCEGALLGYATGAVHIHPTVSEFVPTMMGDLASNHFHMDFCTHDSTERIV